MLCTRTPPNPASGCAAAGLRVTAPLRLRASAVAAQPHSDADRVAAIVRDELGSVSTQAVYDVLRACVGADCCVGSSLRAHPRATRRGPATTTTISCTASCGSVADVDCAVGHAPCLDRRNAHGFAVDEAEVVFWGTVSIVSAESHRSTP